MSDAVRIGLVGVGAITQLVHLPVLAKMRGVQLAALCDIDGAKARALATRFEIRDVYTDIEELLDAGELDGVIVSTPNHLHEPHVLSALASKVHVLCERPLALSARGTDRILAAAQKHDRMVLVGHNHRFRSDVQALKRYLDSGELGRLDGVRAGSYHLKGSTTGWRQNRPEAGGGAFMEHGLPLLDLALWLMEYPEPVRISVHMDRPRGARAVEQAMLVHLECAGGLSFSFDVTWAYVGEEERWWFEVLTAAGSARLAPLRVVKELNGKPVDVSPSGAAARESTFLASYRAELAHFVSVIRGEQPYDPPVEQATLMRVVEAAYRAGDEGKELRL